MGNFEFFPFLFAILANFEKENCTFVFTERFDSGSEKRRTEEAASLHLWHDLICWTNNQNLNKHIVENIFVKITMKLTRNNVEVSDVKIRIWVGS